MDAGVICEYEEDWNYFWDGEYVSSGRGGKDQQHEGGGGHGGVCESGWGEDGGAERVSGHY